MLNITQCFARDHGGGLWPGSAQSAATDQLGGSLRFASESLHLADVDFRDNFAWGASVTILKKAFCRLWKFRFGHGSNCPTRCGALSDFHAIFHGFPLISKGLFQHWGSTHGFGRGSGLHALRGRGRVGHHGSFDRGPKSNELHRESAVSSSCQ